MRATALYLSAMLGEKKAAKQIVAMLKEEPEKGVAHILWRGLAEFSSHKEYLKIVNKLKPDETEETKQIELYIRYRESSGTEKRELAEKLLAAQTPLYAEAAIKFLLKERAFDILGKHFQGEGPYDMSLEMLLYVSAVAQRIFVEARRQGYSIEEKEGKIVFCQTSKTGKA